MKRNKAQSDAWRILRAHYSVHLTTHSTVHLTRLILVYAAAGPLQRRQFVSQLLGVVEHALDLRGAALYARRGQIVQRLRDAVQHSATSITVYRELL